MGLRIDKSVILILTLESSLWGFSLMMFGMTIYLLCRGRSLHQINLWNIMRSCLLLVGSTIHLVSTVIRVVHGFILESHTLNGPVLYLSHIHPESVLMCAMYCFQTLLGDAIVIHRCYVVWQSIWVAVLPIMIWCGTLGFSIKIVYHVARMVHTEDAPLASALGLFMIPVFALTLSANLLSTGLLAYRIYSIDRELARLQAGVIRSVIYPVMRTAIDAGVLYTLLLIAAIINQTKSSDPFELTSIIVPSISIIFYMFIMRIAIAQASQSDRIPKSITTSRSRYISRQLQLTTVDVILSDSKTTEEECGKQRMSIDLTPTSK